METDFVSYRTCSLGAKVSQDPLYRFSQPLHHMVGIELQLINPTFFRYLKARCHLWQNCGKITYTPDLRPWLSGLVISGHGAVKAWLAIRQGVGSYPTPAGMSSQVSA